MKRIILASASGIAMLAATPLPAASSTSEINQGGNGNTAQSSQVNSTTRSTSRIDQVGVKLGVAGHLLGVVRPPP